ncbi:hypothetical protein ACFQS6_17355 [Xanthomonas populi]
MVDDLGPTLMDAGFSPADTAWIAAHPGVAQALGAVNDLGSTLMQAGYSRADIAQIAGNPGGADNLRAVNDLGLRLMRAGYSAADIARIAGHPGGERALGAVNDLSFTLMHAGYSAADIARIAGHPGGEQALRVVNDLGPMLMDAGYIAADIARIAGRDDGAQAVHAFASQVVQALVSAGPAPTQYGVSTNTDDRRSPDEIARTAALHRPGPAFGPENLTEMRQGLGRSAGTPGQLQRARTYDALLEHVERFFHEQNWRDLRNAANGIFEDATDDYEKIESRGPITIRSPDICRLYSGPCRMTCLRNGVSG